ncbi:energy transducer TonB [Aquimarina sp. 2201CG1-2-11]|uniref:energy transducer TonB family protein n=1 Tax=Aquimarina discodermiae TaxID=3231043 RepID=UPI003462EFAD
MEFIEKHKALIITSMLMSIVVLSLYNITMFNKQKEQSEILMEIPEEFLVEEEPEPEEELIAQEDRQLDPSSRTHAAYNEDFEDHDEIEQRIKSLTEADQTEQAPEEASEETDESEIPLEEEKKPAPEEEETNNRNSSLTYNLKDRKSVDLPNPVYTCNGSGRVVVKIEVNQNGYVTNTKVDKKRSSTRNECLFDNAMEYARKALFSSSDIEKQEGSITYYFNYSN